MVLLARRFRLLGVGAVAGALCSNGAWAQPAMPSQEEMWRLIQMQAQELQRQRQEIDALKRVQGSLETSQVRTEEVAVQAQKTATEAQQDVATAVATATAAGPTDGAEGGWWQNTTIGGYGELHYEGGSRDQIDLHRFVLFAGHEFSDKIRFFSELEVEHALAGEGRAGGGAVELEQAYIQMDLFGQHRLNAGLQLVPVGILNEVHEPPTFFGVERNSVETNIIPTTWWEGGLGLNGTFGTSGLSYNFLASSGLNVPLTGANAFRVRNGRQSVASAVARAPALTGRLQYTGFLGVEFGASGHYEFDITQDIGDPTTGDDVSAFLLSAHVNANFNGFGLRALYSSWWIDSAAAKKIGRDRQTGFYLEPSYRFPLADLGVEGPSELGLFYRYSWWDNNAGMSSLGLATNQHIFGVNYWPHPDVVFKLEYLQEEVDAGAKTDRVNAGIGYQF